MTESSLVEQVEALFKEEWGVFQPKFQPWPDPMRKALADLDLWLAGESIVHIQLEHASSNGGSGLVEDATELSVFLLTEHFAVLMVIPRHDGGLFGAPTRYQVKRNDLAKLATSLPQRQGLFEGLTFDLEYDGFPRPVKIKLTDSTVGQPDYESEKEFFAMLRDDYFAEAGE